MDEEKINEQQNPVNKETPKKQPPLTLILGGVAAVCAILAVLFLVLWLGAKNNAPTNQNGDGNSNVGNNGNQSAETPDEISVSSDGYLVVNGVKTEHKIHTEPVISVIDGYVAVNGVKTEYEIKNKNHSFGDWRLYNEGETDCEKKLYYRTCADCSTIEWKEGKYEDHSFKTVTTKPTCQAGGYDTKTCTLCDKAETLNETPKTGHNFVGQYYYDVDYHWRKCSNCGESDTKAAHIMDNGICMVCDPSVQPTEGIAYDISADGTYAEVIGYSGTATKIKIADTYNGLPVKSIYSSAFKNNDKITSVIIPDSVTSIGDSAFCYCSSLTSVVIGDSVRSIGDSAFRNCSSLTSVTIPDSVTSIGYEAFYGCSKLITEYNYCKYVASGDNPYAVLIDTTNDNLSTYEIHPDTRIIARSAFSSCSRLTSITIPDSVRGIGHQAFYDCSSLTSVVIGDSVTSIGDKAFYYCYSLTNVYYTGSEEDWQKISIGSLNSNLTGANIHYDYIPEN